MNVLSDILCNSSPLILSSSYNRPLLSHNASVPKAMSKQSLVLSNEKDLLDSFSTMQNVVRQNGPANLENNLFQSPTAVDMVPSNYGMHHDTDQLASFPTDVLHDTSWFSNELMKASENLPNAMMPQATEYYPTTLGFPQSTGDEISTSCIQNNQTLIHAASSHKYTSSDVLLMSTFPDINGQLPVDKDLSDKYGHNNIMQQNGGAQSLINGMLPLSDHTNIHSTLPETQLHLSLSNHLPGHGTIDSGVMENVQSRDDKLPHISLNQLDSILDSNGPLGGLPMIPNNFQTVSMADKQLPTNYSQQSVMDSCNAVVNCNDNGLSNLNLLQFAQSQDLFEPAGSLPQRCDDFPSTDAIDGAIEQTQCFKCKYCLFLSLDRTNVRNHIIEQHTRTTNNNNNHHNMVSTSVSPLYAPSDLLNGGFGQTSHSNSNMVCNIPTSVQAMPPPPLLPHQQQTETTDGNKRFICSECNLSLGSKKSLKRHLVNMHWVKRNYHSLESSKTKAPADKPSANDIPFQATLGENNIESAENRVLDENSMKTVDAEKRLKENSKKTAMKNVNADAKVMKRQLSSHKKAWQRKMKRELGSYICEFKGCNVRFRAIDNLEYHRKCHVAGSSKFACPECGTLSDNWGTTAGHLWRQHSTDMELHSCDQCSFRTYSLSNLENLHKLIHNDKCVFVCDICDKRFKNGKQLRNHKTIHTKNQKKNLQKKYPCFICSRQFLLKKFLRYHLDVVHNKQRLYTCKFCGYAASKSGTLNIHLRQHTGEKPYSCDQCSYQSADQSSLRRHKMTHSGEKPYKCPFCPYASIQSSTYKTHMKKEHPGQESGLTFSCNICSFHTVRQDNYNAHMADHEMEKASSHLDTNSALRFMSENAIPPPVSDSDVLPLVEAVDISLSHDGRTFHNRDKDISSYLIGMNEMGNIGINHPN